MLLVSIGLLSDSPSRCGVRAAAVVLVPWFGYLSSRAWQVMAAWPLPVHGGGRRAGGGAAPHVQRGGGDPPAWVGRALHGSAREQSIPCRRRPAGNGSALRRAERRCAAWKASPG